jgi:hypothetical protein
MGGIAIKMESKPRSFYEGKGREEEGGGRSIKYIQE